jgi:UDP-glucose 4-epimerase
MVEMAKRSKRGTATLAVLGSTASDGRAIEIVRHRGRRMLVNHDLTPREATLADLVFVREALEAAGIAFHLVHTDRGRPVLALDEADRSLAADALEKAMTREPFYVSRKGHRPVLAADGLAAAIGTAKRVRLHRPRLEPAGGLSYGASGAVRLEFWRFGDTEVALPRENAFLRRVVPRDELTESEVVEYGLTWRTFSPMFERLASDVPFDVDMVFSWVDGSDIEFQRARAKRMSAYVVGEGDDHEARFRQIDELKYALRSVNLFAPWVRRIFIATDSPAPAWLLEHPQVTIVRSEEFFADTSVLPTHNSQAVESQIHRIPGLAEHYLYSNDDMFFGRPVSPSMFFSPGGVTKFVEAHTRIGLGTPTNSRSGFENSARVNRDLLRDRYGVTITRHLEHCPAPFVKSVVSELERALPEDFARTAASRFRSATDVSVTNSLYHYFALATGRAVVQEHAKVLYVDTTMQRGVELMQRLLATRSHDMFCLNDGSFPELEAEERAAIVQDFLEKYFPIVAPWERAARSTSSQAV